MVGVILLMQLRLHKANSFGNTLYISYKQAPNMSYCLWIDMCGYWLSVNSTYNILLRSGSIYLTKTIYHFMLIINHAWMPFRECIWECMICLLPSAQYINKWSGQVLLFNLNNTESWFGNRLVMYKNKIPM